MEDNKKLIESLLAQAVDYGKTSYELVKLKAVNKTSDVGSSFIPIFIVLLILAFVFFFLNTGLALWIGEFTGRAFLGFILVGAFYLVSGLLMYVFLHRWLKKTVRNYIIEQLLK